MKRLTWIVAVMCLSACLGACRQHLHQPPPPPRPLGATFPAAQNTYMKVSDWYVDHSNATGCASDANYGTSSTCGSSGVGPLLNYTEIVARWGTYSPRLPQVTKIHFLSNDADSNADDPIYYMGYSETTAGGAGTNVIFQCDGAGVPVCAGTLGTVTAKNQSTNTLLSVASISNCGPPNLGMGYKVVNTSRSNSVAWVETVSSPGAAPWTLTQPFNPITFPLVTPIQTPTENNSWTTGDAVTVTKPWAIRLVYVNPVYDRMSTTTLPAEIYNCNNGDPTIDFNHFYLPSIVNNTLWVESASVRFLTIDPALGTAALTALYNVQTDDFFGGKAFTFAGNSGSNQFRIYGGQISQPNIVLSAQSVLDGDLVLAGSTGVIAGQGQIGSVANLLSASGNYGTGLIITGDLLVINKSYGTALYGPGVLDVACTGYVSYPGLTATGWLLESGGLKIGNSTTACNGGASAFGASLTPVCGLTLSTANLSAAATQVLSGTVAVVNGSSAVTFSGAQSLTTGQPLIFTSQPGVVYYSAITLVAGTAETLTVAYSGTTNAATTTTTTNTGFSDQASIPGCGGIGTLGP